jgi:NADH-quinone oxidoreductase subunit E/NADP-reducing hydrogenase subunit HndA
MNTEQPFLLDQDIVTFIETCRGKEHPESYLIAVLHKVQERYGYLSKEHMYEVAQRLNVPAATVSGVSTFYHFFRLTPQGKHKISVCMGTACFVKGADQILEAFKKELGIDVGETTKDGMFSLDNTRCLGVCGLAPVVNINDKVYSQVRAKQVVELINKTRAEETTKA